MMRDNAIPLAEIDSLSKEIECIMCLNIGNDARMCIHCSAIVCVECIESWLTRQNSCPKCSHSVQPADFVKCRLANKLVDFIEVSKDKCSQNSNQLLGAAVATGANSTCSGSPHDDDYQQIMTLNHKLLDFIRRRCKDCREKLAAVESALQMLGDDRSDDLSLNDASPKASVVFTKETEPPFDTYQRKKQAYDEAISGDQVLIDDVERRLRESRSLSDQEDILQILQRSIPSKALLREN